MDDLTIRARRPEDADELAALINLPKFRWGTLRLPFQSVAEVRRHIESGHGLGIVAAMAGRIVGSAGLDRYQGRRAHAAGIGLGVHDDFHGRGIGTALVRALLEAADDWLGLQRIELTVWIDNAPAIALYRRHGFVEEGRHRGFALRSGVLVDALAMARVRPAPALATD